MLAVALGANLLARNRLWTTYTLVGVGVLLFMFWLERRDQLRVPPGTLLALFIVGAMHFLGGSLAGLHPAFGVNGAYYVLPWWDNLAHALGGAVVWMMADVVLRGQLEQTTRSPTTSVAAIGLAMLAGVLVELYEFGGFVFFGTLDQGFYTNTMLDLYYDLLGAGAAAVAFHLLDRLPTRADEEGAHVSP